MDPRPSSTTWDDIVLALVRADEITCQPPVGDFAPRCLRLVRDDDASAAASRRPTGPADHRDEPVRRP